jgi:5-methylthioribose kinase
MSKSADAGLEQQELQAQAGFLDPLRAIIHAIGPSSTQDEVLTALNSAKAHAAEARELVKLAEQIAIEWIQENKRDLIVSDTVRYYVGTEKKEACKDVRAACEKILDKIAGDFAAFADCLSSNPFKFGAVRKLLGDAYAATFTTTTVTDLKTGKPAKALKKSDDSFKR